jgi:hypothetical protein
MFLFVSFPQVAVIKPNDDKLAEARTTLLAMPGATDKLVDEYLRDFNNAVLALQKKFPERVTALTSSDSAATVANAVL